jgi:hypothetical protein
LPGLHAGDRSGQQANHTALARSGQMEDGQVVELLGIRLDPSGRDDPTPSVGPNGGVEEVVFGVSVVPESLDHGEQYDRVLVCLQGVAGQRDRHQLAGLGVPGPLAGDQLHAPREDLQGGFTGAFVLVEPVAGQERDQGLSQTVVVAAEQGVRAAPGRSLPGAA